MDTPLDTSAGPRGGVPQLHRLRSCGVEPVVCATAGRLSGRPASSGLEVHEGIRSQKTEPHQRAVRPLSPVPRNRGPADSCRSMEGWLGRRRRFAGPERRSRRTSRERRVGSDRHARGDPGHGRLPRRRDGAIPSSGRRRYARGLREADAGPGLRAQTAALAAAAEKRSILASYGVPSFALAVV